MYLITIAFKWAPICNNCQFHVIFQQIGLFFADDEGADGRPQTRAKTGRQKVLQSGQHPEEEAQGPQRIRNSIKGR